jgi:hypothetical protein
MVGPDGLISDERARAAIAVALTTLVDHARARADQAAT